MENTQVSDFLTKFRLNYTNVIRRIKRLVHLPRPRVFFKRRDKPTEILSEYVTRLSANKREITRETTV